MGDEGGARALAAAVDASGALVLIGEPAATPSAAVRSAARRRQPHGRTNRLLALAIVLVLGAALLLAVWQDMSAPGGLVGGPSASAARARLQAAPPVEAVLYDTRNLPIDAESAIDINAKRPPDIAKVVPARSFVAGGGPADAAFRQTALECLAQAVYYEAASESDAGQRAVAQVVLNRVRSPAFPNTVCGVVFQGWTRSTGCQFSFTCDGSMQRIPSASGMARARRIAADALSGVVMREVGNATHYHADYVVPYWASSLDKVQTVGRHIFYLIRGGLGRPGAFSARYLASLERSPLGTLANSAMNPLEEVLPGQEAALPGAMPPSDPLAADLAMGKLIAPDGAALVGTAGGLGHVAPGREAGGLKADAGGGLEAGGGALIADERKGALRSDEKQPGGN